MKNLWLLIVPLFFLACEEEIIIEKIIEKPVYRDSIVYRDRPSLLRVDTVNVEVITTETDTLIYVETDSVFITETITEIDTVILIEHHYHDTLFQYLMYTTTYIPSELQPIVILFHSKAREYGVQIPGGEMIINYVENEELPAEGWSSFSMNFGSQIVILVSRDLDVEQLFTPIFREMARIQMKKKYVFNNTIMDPLFDPYEVGFSETSEHKPYLDDLFQ